jgi:hypothetical protein
MTVWQKKYYTLVASLPLLPHFEHAERVPINRYRLDQRLKMLDAGHAGQLAGAWALIGWRPERPFGKGDDEAIQQYLALMGQRLHPALAEYVSLRMDQQTIMAALRRRQSTMAPPSGGQKWGAGQWARWIEQHWDDPDFRFGSMVPWVHEARGFLEAGEAVPLERLLMNIAWQVLNRIAERDTFGFEAVTGYVFKWDILNSWLAQNREAGKEQFQKLIEEVMHG